MTYLEIIEWIQEKVIEFEQADGYFDVAYIGLMGTVKTHSGKDLISIVLEINGKELIK